MNLRKIIGSYPLYSLINIFHKIFKGNNYSVISGLRKLNKILICLPK